MTSPVPILFAHRGGRAHGPENSIEAFERALAHGTPGIETDAFVTTDGVVVLHHGGVIGKRRKARPIGALRRSDLPPSVPTLQELLVRLDDSTQLFIDVKGGSIDAVARTVDAHWPESRQRLWLAHSGYNDSDWQLVASWCEIVPQARLVDSTSVDRMQGDIPRYLDRIAAAGIDCLNLPAKEWNAALVADARERGLKTMGFGVHNKRRARRAARLGLDAVHGDDIDVLKAVLING